MKKLASALLVLALTTPLMTSCGAAATRANVSAPVDDATITTRVKTAFINDPAVGKAENKIDVDTFKGVVTLTGTVKNKDEEQKAIALARSIRGVTDVKSTLQVQ
jgi:osmotically-inducible protein OsmY